ncbi:replication protein [Thomasclavelia cocleata]|uniref:replication protein n=1 Tax=Thomasclavelia cocleata TaxID=69824 RepID=UPI0026339A65|nr:replication protein [Thomasclavelia cocleata]
MAKDKARYFTFLLYPESIPEDWEMKLESIGVPIAISPLHNKDKSIVEGQEYKKEHYHVIYVAKNPVTVDSISKKVKSILGDKSLSHVQIIRQSIENVYLYLTHESKDAIAKNKYKYNKKDIKLINNFDIDRYVSLDAEDKDEMLNVVCDLIDDYGLANIRELRRFIRSHGEKHNLPTMHVINKVLRSHTGLIRLYFDGVYQERKYKESYVDVKTGEVKPPIK